MAQLLTRVSRPFDAALLGQPELLVEIQDFLLPLVDLGPEVALRRGGPRLLSLWIDAASLHGAGIDEYSGAAIFQAVQKNGLGFLERAVRVAIHLEVWTSVANCAVRHNALDVLVLLMELVPRLHAPQALDIAASVGDLKLLQWVYDCEFGGSGVTDNTLARAVREGHVEVVEWVLALPNLQRRDQMITRAISRAAHYGQLEVLRRLLTASEVWCSPVAVSSALLNGHYAVADWLHKETRLRFEGQTGPFAPSPRNPHWLNVKTAIGEAFTRGDIRMLEWLRARGLLQVSAKYTLRAKVAGHVHVLNYLERHMSDSDALVFTPPCAAGGSIAVAEWANARGLLIKTMETVQIAGRFGHLEFIKWYEQTVGKEMERSWDAQAIEIAAVNGHFECVKHLAEHDYDSVRELAVHRAAVAGQLEIAQWLFAHLKVDIPAMVSAQEDPELAGNEAVYTPFALSLGDTMNEAASAGHLGVVKWLHAMGFTFYPWAIREAASKGHLDVVQYLVKHSHTNDTQGALKEAAVGGHFRVVKYLLSHFPRERTEHDELASAARSAGHAHIAKWILSSAAKVPQQG